MHQIWITNMKSLRLMQHCNSPDFTFSSMRCLHLPMSIRERELFVWLDEKFWQFWNFSSGFEDWTMRHIKESVCRSFEKDNSIEKCTDSATWRFRFFSWCPANTWELPKFFCLWKKSQIKTGFTCLLYLALKRIKLIFHALNVSVILLFAWNSATILPICFAVGKNSITANYLFKQIGKLSNAAWKACHAHLNSKKTEIQIGQTATKFWAVVPVRQAEKSAEQSTFYNSALLGVSPGIHARI